MLASIHDSRYQLLQALLSGVRKDAGITQIQIAERLGVGQSFISKIERGEAYVDVFFFLDWCVACGVPNPEKVFLKLLDSDGNPKKI